MALIALYAAPVRAAQGDVASNVEVPSWGNWVLFNGLLPIAARQLGLSTYDAQDYAASVPLLAFTHALEPRDHIVARQLGFAYKETGEYEKGHDLLFQSTVIEPESYFVWWWLGDAQRLLGEYTKARDSLATARDLAPEAQKSQLNDFIAYTESLGTSVPSWSVFEKHREFAKRHEKNRRVRRVIAEYMSALDTVPPIGPNEHDAPLRVAWVNNQIGVQYNQLKEPHAALDYFQRARAHYAATNSPGDVLMCLQNLALTHALLADTMPGDSVTHLEESIALWGQVLAGAKEQKDPVYERYARGLMLQLLTRTRALDDPLLAEQRAANLMELPWQGPINDYSVAAVAQGEIACRMKEGDLAGARIVAEMTLPYFEQSGFLLDSEEFIRIRVHLSHIYLAQGHPGEALKHADVAAAKVRELRTFMDADAFGRSGNDLLISAVAAAGMRAEIALGNADAAQVRFEAYAAQVQRDLVGSIGIDEAGRSDLRTEREIISRRLPAIEADLASAPADSPEARRLAERVSEDKLRLEWLDKGLRFQSSSVTGYEPITPLSIASLRNAWPADTALLSIVADEHGGVALVFDGAAVRGHKIDGFTTARVVELLAGNADELPQRLAAFGEEHFANVLSGLTQKTLYVAAAGLIAAVPFEGLAPGGAPLMARHDIAYTPSGSHLIAARALPRVETSTQRAIIADNAPWPQAHGGARVVLQGAQATESALLRPEAPARILWLRAPANFAAPDPMLAHFTLAAGDKDDGDVYAAELLSATLGDQLAVLHLALPVESVQHNEDLARWNALQEGFLQAGVRAVISNRRNLAPMELAGLVEGLSAPGAAPLAALSQWKREQAAGGGSAWLYLAFQGASD